MHWWMWPLLAWLPLSAVLAASWHWATRRADSDEFHPGRSSAPAPPRPEDRGGPRRSP